MRAKNGAPQEWLKAHIHHQGDDCLVWPFGHSGTGYAQVRWEGRPHTASRIMCILAHGDPPVGKQEVAHSCGNRKCVNPSHLRHASWEENSADKIKQGRENFGERNGQSKLSEADVLQIIQLHHTKKISQARIGKMFGVRDTAVCRIISGKRWSHLTRTADKTALKDALMNGESIPGAELQIGLAGLTIRVK